MSEREFINGLTVLACVVWLVVAVEMAVYF